jgi:hypothetical protein
VVVQKLNMAQPARWWADATRTLGIARVVAVLAHWLHHAGLQAAMVGDAPAGCSLGRLTGLLAADLLLIQVFLMARIPLIERGYGQDRLTRWHRDAGTDPVLAARRAHPGRRR